MEEKVKTFLSDVSELRDRFNREYELLAEEFQDDNVESLELGDKIFTDGSGYNGSKSGFCITSQGKNEYFEFHHNFTNNEMEYFGVIAGLIKAEVGAEIFTDSQLVVEQLKGKFRLKAQKLLPLYMIAKSISKKKSIKVSWVKRDDNLAGKHIEKEDERRKRESERSLVNS